MQHVDVELLAMLALQAAEPDEETAAHLSSCAECQAELAALQRVVTAGRSAPRESDLSEPPVHVWQGIAEAVGTSAMPREGAPDETERTRGELHRGPGQDAPPLETSAQETSPQELPARPATPPSRRVPTWLAVAAGLVVGALGAGTLVAVLDSDDPDDPSPRVVADAELDPLGETGTAGSAEVVEVDGTRRLDVQIDDVPPGGDFREVWLLDAEAQRLVSLGVLTGTQASLVIPDGLDLAEFPVVDVSREPLDGDPAHSSDSISRGTLEL
jgi:hypothetical protein